MHVCVQPLLLLSKNNHPVVVNSQVQPQLSCHASALKQSDPGGGVSDLHMLRSEGGSEVWHQGSAPASAVPLAGGSPGGRGACSGSATLSSYPSPANRRITLARWRSASSSLPSSPIESWNSLSFCLTPSSVSP